MILPVLDSGIKDREGMTIESHSDITMSQLNVPFSPLLILSLSLSILSLSIGLTSGQDESNRRIAYGILLANPMGAPSSPYPMYQFPMQQMQQPY